MKRRSALFTKETEILKLVNSVNEMKNELECTGKRDQMEERISKLEDRNLEAIQVKHLACSVGRA